MTVAGRGLKVKVRVMVLAIAVGLTSIEGSFSSCSTSQPITNYSKLIILCIHNVL